ncbi:hypothetical protein BU24DRAFT_426207 [Aaosphaeria arxii CBS 175.79]|uniref:Uncharacterized protein n=1 Tax=Aaosphaeria arxii CBS 175.79 TaxID=1450172 RepID=A0A6A5XHK2_9PLEO|nr:uncharacterized protein BU24DRAFT_426207 [Aaosphaeria arxii CBS 175.79]KAF2012337.1 hypothetical protein BU24DRAFT_426207 [Aaosphaeria arxii CBS 175.79]
MCMKATCDNCQKSTWRGCGRHIPTVMDSIPHDQWCTCDPKVDREGVVYPPAVGTGTPAPNPVPVAGADAGIVHGAVGVRV